MKNKKCPIRSQCWDYKSGNCENCDLGDHITKLQKKIDRLKAKNKKLKAQSEWISVEDRLPEQEGETFLYYDGKVVDACMFYSGRFYTIDLYESDRIDGVTHWMPLPEPPKKKVGE